MIVNKNSIYEFVNREWYKPDENEDYGAVVIQGSFISKLNSTAYYYINLLFSWEYRGDVPIEFDTGFLSQLLSNVDIKPKYKHEAVVKTYVHKNKRVHKMTLTTDVRLFTTKTTVVVRMMLKKCNATEIQRKRVDDIPPHTIAISTTDRTRRRMDQMAIVKNLRRMVITNLNEYLSRKLESIIEKSITIVKASRKKTLTGEIADTVLLSSKAEVGEHIRDIITNLPEKLGITYVKRDAGTCC